MPTLIASQTQRTSTSASSATITIPAQVVAGDVLILSAFWLVNSVTITPPPGWEQASYDTRTGISAGVWWKVAGPGDAGASVLVSASDSRPNHLTVWAIRDVSGLTAAAAMNRGSGSTSFPFPPYVPDVGRTPLQILCLTASAAGAHSVTGYAAGMEPIQADLATATQRTSTVLAAATGWSETTTPGTSWMLGDTGQYGVSFTVGLVTALAELARPRVALVRQTFASAVGATDATVTISWPPVAGAVTYDAYLSGVPGTPASSDFVRVAQNVTSPYTFTGLGEGPAHLGVRAIGA